MIVLGFDTSTTATAVAVRGRDGQVSQARDDPPAGAHPGHATRLLEMARELLAGAGIAWSELERIAVGVGPGTFTGLRVGVATARGLAQSLSIELVGVSSPRALAATALAADAPPSSSAGERSAVLAIIDARRGEVFAAAYEAGDGGAPHELAAPKALPPQELSSFLSLAEEAAAGEPRRWSAVGDGAVRFRGDLEAAGIPTPPDCSPLHLISAIAVCELGARAASVGIAQVVPDYRRRPDAELALEGAGTARGSLR
jgi:tRNA threonylcarbamoyladenosine biosynthesis protein TsaB